MYKLIIIFITVISISACATRDLSPMELQKKQAELIKRCKGLKKDIDDLVGSPIRRNAAIEYYQSECNSRSDAAHYPVN